MLSRQAYVMLIHQQEAFSVDQRNEKVRKTQLIQTEPRKFAWEGENLQMHCGTDCRLTHLARH